GAARDGGLEEVVDVHGPRRAGGDEPAHGRGKPRPYLARAATRAAVVCSGSPGYTNVSQPWRSGASPLMMSKNAVWIASVIGPRRPLPTAILSTERIGVISTAVPAKNASSAM